MSNYKINIENLYPDVPFKTSTIKYVANIVLAEEGVFRAEITFILVDDEYIKQLNQKFLKKDKTTDVISFNLEDMADAQKEGEVYANVQQIMRQSNDFAVSFKEEFYRVLIHGLLHVIGYTDQTSEDRQTMTEKEDYYLQKIEPQI